MNVAFDDWIPVVTTTGKRQLASLCEVLTNGGQFADLAVRPHERVAVMRLFLCVAHAALDGQEVASEGDGPPPEDDRGGEQPAQNPQHESSEEPPEEQTRLHAGEHKGLFERIERSRKLPKGLRDRLNAFAEKAQWSEDGREQPTLRVSDALAMLEEAIPDRFVLAADHLRQGEHPSGEAFFTGDARQMTDDEAQRIASEQLANTGFGPCPTGA